MPHQVSVFAENKPGKISRVTSVLTREEINIRAITISDSGDYGIIKLLLDRPVDGVNSLKNDGIAASLKDIVAIKVEDRPGGLHEAASVLGDKMINVEDAYGFTIRGSNEAVFVFQVADVKETETVLKDAGFAILTDQELYYL